MKTIKYKILFPILCLTLISNFIIFFSIRISSEKVAEEQVTHELNHVIDSVTASVEASNNHELSFLKTLARLPSIKDSEISLYDKSKVIHDFFLANRDDYIDLFILDTKGNGYIKGLNEFTNMKSQEFFKTSFWGCTFIQNPFFNDIYKKMTICYSVPVYDDNRKIINVIVSVIDGYRYSELVKTFNIGKSSKPYIFDRILGDIIASSKTEDLDKTKNLSDYDGLSTIYADIVTESSNLESFYYSNSNEMQLAISKRVKNTEWVVVAPVQYSDFSGTFDNLQKRLMVVCFVILFFVIACILIIIKKVLKPLPQVEKSMHDVSQGSADLTQRILIDTKDEIGKVVEGFNLFMEKLQDIVSRIKISKDELDESDVKLEEISESTLTTISKVISSIKNVNVQLSSQTDKVKKTSSSITEISSDITGLEDLVEDQVACVTEASSSVTEMISNISSVNSSVEKMAFSFENLLSEIRNGSTLQENVNNRIIEIENQSEILLSANSVIAAIAEQTNLLAMNAAIEAAHAGDAGRGFSVVAEEIRKLSETSSEQSKTIGEQLSKIQNLIESVVGVSSETNKVFALVSEKIQETGSIILQIKTAMEEQQIGSTQINQALSIMNTKTCDVYTASKDMLERNKIVLNEVSSLKDSTATMNESIKSMDQNAHSIKEISSAFVRITKIMKDSIEKIGEEIDLFKV